MNTWYTSTPRKSLEKENSPLRRQDSSRDEPIIQKTPVRSQISELCRTSILKNSRSKISSTLYRAFPNYTPPSKISRSVVKNPFENASHLLRDLSHPFCSPSLFQSQSSSTTNTEDQFSWSIDDISSFKPALIDENPSQEFASWYSPTTELKAQEAIKEYFDNNHKVQSPLFQTNNLTLHSKSQSNIAKLPSRSSEDSFEKFQEDKACQTSLSFPKDIPAHLEELLASYIHDSSQMNISNTSFGKRKKLDFDDFDSTSGFKDNSSSSPEVPSLMDYNSSPFLVKRVSPEISPINMNERNRSIVNHSRNALDFSDIMMNSVVELS